MDTFDLRQWNSFAEAGGVLAEPALIDDVVIDSRRVDSPNTLFVALKGEKDDGHRYIQQAARSGARFALVAKDWISPDTLPGQITLLRVPSTLEALQQIAKSYREKLPARIIGLAGSFGKTMTKDLLHALLSTQFNVGASPESFNSQIGVALSLLSLRTEHSIGIIEAAISHPNEMDILANMIHPTYTIMTPVGKKHMATLKDLSKLKEETFKLIKATPAQGWSLLPQEDKGEINLSHLACPVHFWDSCDSELPFASPSPSAPLTRYRITFPSGDIFEDEIKNGHAYFFNLINMAIRAAWLLGISSENIVSILQNYQPEPSRTEIWKSSLGTTFINDTYCSDPQSIDHSLKHFHHASPESRNIFVFGGMRSETDRHATNYRRIGKAIACSKIKYLCLVGQKDFLPLIEEVQRISLDIAISSFEDYPSAFSYLREMVKGSDFILFKGESKLSLDRLTETFSDSLSNNQCIINLAAVQANLTLIRKHLPSQTRIMVMVKALAYGTDDVRMAKFLANNGIDILGVSYVDEGIALKRAGIEQAIFSINAAPYEAAKIVKWDLEVGVSDKNLANALALEAARAQKKVKVHLHINTGMGRFGCRPEEAKALALHIGSLSSLILEGVMTHFACSEDPKEDPFTLHQVSLFDTTIAEIEASGIPLPWKHAANSAGALRFSFPQYNMVRLGLALYGLYGSEEAKKSVDLRLATSLVSRIVGINECKRGDSISYGRRYVVENESQKIAVLPIGYFDGLHRHYSGKAHVLIHGQKAPMVGNICMDNLMVDVTDIPNVEVGDKALIFGEDEYGHFLSPEELAICGGSIVHELITCLGPRIPRIFVYEEKMQVR